MKIVILGSGVIGVTSAWYLAQAGFEVEVIDRQPSATMETSFANAGQISPGYSSPWAAPGIPLKAVKWLFMKHAPLIIQPQMDMAKLRWMIQMLGNCTNAAYAVNKGRMVRLAEYSRDCLDDLRARTGITFDERQQGTLQLFRNQKQLDGAGKDIEVLRAGGVAYELLDVAGCVAAEPGLRNSQDRIVGGLRLPGDQTGDCFKFTEALAQKAAAAGVTFRHDTVIQRLNMAGGRVVSVATTRGEITGDAFVLAMGSYSPELVASLGMRLPIYPVKGYSITMPIVDSARAPTSTVMDETYKIAITRLGERIRVGGMAELAGFDLSLSDKRKQTLLHSVQDLFGGAGDAAQADFWTGLRPMTPDGTPIVGRSPVSNLYMNTGHGTLGWTMAAGSGRVLADIVAGRETEIESADLGFARYLGKASRPRSAGGMRPAMG